MKEVPGPIGHAEVGYDAVLADVVVLIQDARRAASRSVNAVMTTAFWRIGRRLIEREQGGARWAAYGEEVLARLAADLTARFGRGFSVDRLETARLFYLAYPDRQISATPSRKSLVSNSATPSRSSAAKESEVGFPLAWSHYVLLLRRVGSDLARAFYEAESLRGGWTVRQLERQIASQFYERTALSRNKASMLRKGSIAKQSDATTPEEEIKDPLVLEFLGLKDEYSESDLEEALIAKLESFLLEMGGDFAFVGRQRRLRIGSQWFRVDRRASTARDSAYGMRLEGYRRDYPLGVARCFLRRSVSAMLRTPRGRSGEHGSSC